MTPAGLQNLKEELRTLKTIERPRISKEIEVARGHGDLRENSEYHAAKEKQAHIEARIRLIDDWLANAEVIDVTKLKGEQVVFGATVVLLDLETEKEVRYRIVGEVEADLKKRHLSVTSPVARADQISSLRQELENVDDASPERRKEALRRIVLLLHRSGLALPDELQELVSVESEPPADAARLLSIAPSTGPLATPLRSVGWRVNPRLLGTLYRR